MVLVKGGDFTMGDGVNHAEYPFKTGSFFMGAREVTNREYADACNWALENGRIYIATGKETRARPEPPYAMGEKRPDFMYMDLEYLVRYDKKTFWPLFEQWRKTCGITYRDGQFSVRPGMEELPMVAVSWIGAVVYCNWISERDGLKPAYETVFWDILPKTDGYRLPANEEWEWAARGGLLSAGYTLAGGNDPDAVAWHAGNAGGVVNPVGLKLPNELGLYDMSGNAWEFCTERFGNFRGTLNTGVLEGGLMGSYHLWRGGSCTTRDLNVHIYRQHVDSPGYLQGQDDVGFRVILPL
jgi:formylglycine-generating enzyme required for sulfatase activity